MDDAVCPGSGHGDFPAIMAAPREIGFDGYLMLEGFGYLAAERNSRGAFFLGGGI
jgi:D-psicose/D-tagatose/L-ribulose 3-epimerase